MFVTSNSSETFSRPLHINDMNFNWRPRKVAKVDDPSLFAPRYEVVAEATSLIASLKTKFADLPTFGLWADRTESDDELLKELGSGWRGFANEQ